MKIQGNLINNYNYNKLNLNVKTSKEDKKTVDIRNGSEEDEKTEAARVKQKELEAAAEEIKRQAEEAKEQMEAKNKETRKFGTILEIFRRVARGDKVSPKDEGALMEYDMKLYFTAKNAAQLAANKKTKKHKKSLIEELEKTDKERQSKKAEEAEKESASGENTKTDEARETNTSKKEECLGTSVDISI